MRLWARATEDLSGPTALLNTEDLGETFELTVTDKLSAGTAFADGYDRISLVTAESLSTGEKLVYCSSEDGTIDYPTWNYLSESESVIPRTGVYQLTQTVFTIISGYTTDPVGPTTGSARIARSGGWGNTAGYCRIAYCHYGDPSAAASNRSFRLAIVQ